LEANKDVLEANKDVLEANKDVLITNKAVLIADKDVLEADKDVFITNKDVLIYSFYLLLPLRILQQTKNDRKLFRCPITINPHGTCPRKTLSLPPLFIKIPLVARIATPIFRALIPLF
jgi:hypothetical protein